MSVRFSKEEDRKLRECIEENKDAALAFWRDREILQLGDPATLVRDAALRAHHALLIERICATTAQVTLDAVPLLVGKQEQVVQACLVGVGHSLDPHVISFRPQQD